MGNETYPDTSGDDVGTIGIGLFIVSLTPPYMEQGQHTCMKAEMRTSFPLLPLQPKTLYAPSVTSGAAPVNPNLFSCAAIVPAT